MKLFVLAATSALFAGSAGAQVPISGVLSDATTGPLLSGTVYHAGSISVQAGTTLTVQAGAIVKFSTVGATFEVQGTLNCQGTLAQPVIFTDIKDDTAGGDTNGDGPSAGVAGHWTYLRIYPTANASVLEHTHVRFAGRNGWGGLTLQNSEPALRDCVISNCLVAGMDLIMGVSQVAAPIVERCQFNDNGGAAVTNVRLSDLPGFSQCTASGNAGGNYQAIIGVGASPNVVVQTDDLIGGVGVLTASQTLPSGQSLTFGPGVVMKMGVVGGAWEVQGTLISQGSAGSPVVFTEIEDDSAGGDTNADGPSAGAAGYWTYMRFYPTASASVLDHAHVRFAGRNGWGGVTLQNSEPTLRDCVISNCMVAGMDLIMGVSQVAAPIVERCQFNDNGGAAVTNMRFQHVTGFSHCTASGNLGGNYMSMPGHSVFGNVVVQTDNLIGGVAVCSQGPNVPAGSNLTLGPGVVVKAASNHIFAVSGGFSTQGTTALPVVLTSFGDDAYAGDTDMNGPSTGTPGSWIGLWLQGTGAATSIDGLLVRYAGGNGFSSVIHFASPASYTLSDSRVEYGAAHGFELRNHAGTARGLTAWKCGGTGMLLTGGSFDLRQATSVACGTGIGRAAPFGGTVVDSIVRANTISNTSGFAAGQWRFSCGNAALAGVDGNISADPIFYDEQAGDFRIHYGSPCRDTGDPTSPLDVDTTRADMGAYPIDHRVPVTYCIGKTNSCGTVPAIGWSGSMHAGATSGFTLRATNARGLMRGLLLYSNSGAASLDFGGSVLCIQAPLRRAVGIMDSVGTAGLCDGVLSLDFATFATGGLGGNPAAFLQQPGTPLWCQFWGRDPGISDPLLSDAVTFQVQP